MSDMKQNAIAKIRKLLALAADPSAEGAEAENAARQATKLMIKFQIEESELEDGSVGIRCGFAYARHMNLSLIKAPMHTQFIAVGVADFLGCVCTLINRIEPATGKQSQLFKFAGEVSDVKLAVWLCETMCLAASRAWSAYKGEETKVAFSNGYGSAVQSRLRAMLRVKEKEETEIKASDSRALIVLDKKVAVIREKFGSAEYKQHDDVKLGLDGWKAGQAAVIPSGAIGSAAPAPALS